MKRRDFMRVLGGAAATWPLTAQAEQRIRIRRLGVIIATGKTPEYEAAFAALQKSLESLGWILGVNLLIDDVWGAASLDNARAAAIKITAVQPDVILGQSATVIAALRDTTQSIPIVFLHVPDPVASGFVSSLARPEANVTGITNTVPSMGGKWLHLLKEIVPTLARSAMLVNPDTQVDRGALYLKPFHAAARSMGITPVKGEVRSVKSIETVMRTMGAEPGGSIIVVPNAFFASHSNRIVGLAERFRLPAIYPYRYYVAQGGLMSYGVNNVDLFRQAAPYLDRILRGAKPSELPVQRPTRFQLIINKKTADALGLSLRPIVLAQADEIIE
jgi:putative ABC transport system substrate-binding protein